MVVNLLQIMKINFIEKISNKVFEKGELLKTRLISIFVFLKKKNFFQYIEVFLALYKKQTLTTRPSTTRQHYLERLFRAPQKSPLITF